MVSITTNNLQYPVSDLLNWYKAKSLVLNPEFQRRDNWTSRARSYLIDSLLRGMPIPNIYIRMRTDPETMMSYREVVDGQQRLRTIFGFIDGAFALANNAQEFSGMRYEDLEIEDQRALLGYQVGTVQLYEATDDMVLDVFQRLNAYGLSLNSQELRHGKYLGGKYRGAFRSAVIDASERWVTLWDIYKVVTVRSRVRMGDHELIAQMFGVLTEGVVDGGQASINRLYESLDNEVPTALIESFDLVVGYIIESFAQVLETRIASSPNFLMLFAAVAHALIGIPDGAMGDTLPPKLDEALSDLVAAHSNLMLLGNAFDLPEEEVPSRFEDFVLAAGASTQRIKSRSIRFLKLYEALLPEEI